MSTFESSHKSLLQGVSQQIPKERLEGQVSAQLNMMSDPVTNLRRRPGAEYKYSRVFSGLTTDNLRTWYTDLAGESMHVLLNTSTGYILLLDKDLNELAYLNGGTYLQAASVGSIRSATVGNEMFLCNVEKAPVASGSFGTVNPTLAGFAYVVSGSFSRAYTITYADSVGTYTASYTTPSGSGAGDAALATPEYIATQLMNALTSNVARTTFSRLGAYIYAERAAGQTFTGISMNTSSGSVYMVASKDGYVTTTGQLPAQLPSQANGYICRVGDLAKPQYYQYSSTSTSWKECGAYGSPTSLTSMPVSIAWNGTAWYVNTTPFDGRSAGDDETNEQPAFLDYGITGISTYQGRLVLLAGPMVNLSASNKPRRFFRSTVTSVLASDPIEVGSSMNSSSAYEYAVPFQKDLVLFSAAYQALIPSGNQAITPTTATVVPTSAHNTDVSAAPLAIGRTILYCTPRSADFFGVSEMIPSPYTDSQYVSQDATAHLPKYMGGRCRFSVSSSTSGMALFAPSGDKRSLIVHEYMWDGDQKAQHAWHTWTFPYDIAGAYFANERIILAFVRSGTIVLCSIDPKAGVLTFDAARRPFADLWSSITITNRAGSIPAWLLAFDPTVHTKARLEVLNGELAGSLIGSTMQSDGSIETVRSFTSGTVGIGIGYQSTVVPTPPVIKDYNGVAISTNKATVLRYLVGTKNSSEYKVTVSDRNSDVVEGNDVGTLTWSSRELELGRALFSTDSVSVVPCRTDMDTTVLEIGTNGTGELNITSLEYVVRYNQKIKRR